MVKLNLNDLKCITGGTHSGCYKKGYKLGRKIKYWNNIINSIPLDSPIIN